MYSKRRTAVAVMLVVAAGCHHPVRPPVPPRPLTPEERGAGTRIKQFRQEMMGNPTSTFSKTRVPGMTIEKLKAYLTSYYVVQTGRGSMSTIAREEPPEVVVEDENGSHLRMVIVGARREVIREREYWELLYLDFWLTMLDPQDARSKAPDMSGDVTLLPLDRAIKPPVTYELSLVASGRYAAGGRPASTQAFPTDFSAGGFGDELELYVRRILGNVSRFFKVERE